MRWQKQLAHGCQTLVGFLVLFFGSSWRIYASAHGPVKQSLNLVSVYSKAVSVRQLHGTMATIRFVEKEIIRLKAST